MAFAAGPTGGTVVLALGPGETDPDGLDPTGEVDDVPGVPADAPPLPAEPGPAGPAPEVFPVAAVGRPTRLPQAAAPRAVTIRAAARSRRPGPPGTHVPSKKATVPPRPATVGPKGDSDGPYCVPMVVRPPARLAMNGSTTGLTSDRA